MPPKIKSLHIYPIKSMQGIDLQSMEIHTEGPKLDRRWMLVDEGGCFITQRNIPLLACMSLTLVNDHISISYAGEEVKFETGQFEGEAFPVKIWKNEINLREVSSGISKWISDILKTKCKLVGMTGETRRMQLINRPPFRAKVSLADSYPYLLLGDKSMDLLNDKLPSKLDINRFRANIVFETGRPHEEDNWERLEINHTGFRNIKPCARCIITTIDQITGEKGIEPLKTLSGYRKRSGKVLFGMYALPLRPGTVRVGDIAKLL